MKYKFYLLILLFAGRICTAQNLVPNGDFEHYSNCPTVLNQLSNALSWIKPTLGSSDYYNQCSNSTLVDVPNNYFGFQPAHSGTGYSGIHPWSANMPNYREYLEVQFTSPLVANTTYHLDFYINLGNACTHTTDALGAYFSDTLITNYITQLVLPYVPQINNPIGNVTDTLNWTLFSGDYRAVG